MGFLFKWDKNKAKKNEKKHNISFEEATTIFGDPLSITISDPIHSNINEERYITIGLSYRQRILVVVHCDRGDIIRIISARKAIKRELKEYEG